MPLTGSGSLNLREWTAPEDCLPRTSPAGPIDARGADWSGQDLGTLDLRESKLCRCDLRGTDLSRCTLTGADLRLARYDNKTAVPEGFDLHSSGAIGPGAKLNGAYLNSSDLRGMDLRGSMLLGAYLSGADMSGALLDGVSLAGADLRYVTLRGAMCRGARFGTCELDMADLRGANMEGAALDAVGSIKGADFSFCLGLEAQIDALLSRSAHELDCWNPVTRCSTRSSLESLRRQSRG